MNEKYWPLTHCERGAPVTSRMFDALATLTSFAVQVRFWLFPCAFHTSSIHDCARTGAPPNRSAVATTLETQHALRLPLIVFPFSLDCPRRLFVLQPYMWNYAQEHSVSTDISRQFTSVFSGE